MNSKYIGEGVCGTVMAISTVAQTNEFLQTIQLIICIVAGIVGIILTLWRLIKMYKQSKADGEITNEERAEMAAEVLHLTEQIKDLTQKVKDSKKEDE
jgi:signal transduction histidine kinase